MESAQDFLDGKVLLIDKPLQWTSFQVVNKLRWEIRRAFKLKKIKVGHAGTLDPLATGLLIICTGKMTKQIQQFQAEEKEYTGIITIGSTTPSFDLETEVNETFPTEHITQELIEATTKQFVGEIQQKPPIFSAIKKDGKRLYDIARAGDTVEIKARTVTISEFEITMIEENNLHFKVICSKGTYIRSLSNDFGQALGSGAHLSALRRTRIGNSKIENALQIEEFIASITSE